MYIPKYPSGRRPSPRDRESGLSSAISPVPRAIRRIIHEVRLCRPWRKCRRQTQTHRSLMRLHVYSRARADNSGTRVNHLMPHVLPQKPGHSSGIAIQTMPSD